MSFNCFDKEKNHSIVFFDENKCISNKNPSQGSFLGK